MPPSTTPAAETPPPSRCGWDSTLTCVTLPRAIPAPAGSAAPPDGFHPEMLTATQLRGFLNELHKYDYRVPWPISDQLSLGLAYQACQAQRVME